MSNDRHMHQHRVKIFCTGGTIDKVYFDAISEYQIGDPVVQGILKEALVQFPFDIEAILKKDSLDITGDDRDLIYFRVTS